MKPVWVLLAILFTCLALGGLMGFTKRGDPFDLIITAGLGAAAIGCWSRVKAKSSSS
ncbi:hypothetical protein ACFVT5_41470 [Streptomyces sp. NPDC058001]|uniref:hypothetical protein n=1 Tax=Streptomyces sp. NPDC058001 TaxID=3346300 RepID=UPI0036EBE16C